MEHLAPDVADIRSALSVLELLRRDNVDLKKQGPNLVALCPFHQEKTPSFTWSPRFPNTVHCFGCGWHGDIFSYWMERTGTDFKTAKDALAAMAGLTRGQRTEPKGQIRKKMSALPHQPYQQKEKPALPKMRKLSEDEIAALAVLRGLDAAALAHVASKRLIGFCDWPQFQRSEVRGQRSGWELAAHCYPSWVITDRSRNVAQFRRLDGGKYSLHEREIKAWTKGSPTWPIGAGELASQRTEDRGRRSILLVEGGPDFLAAYHFLLADWRLKNGRVLRPDFLPVAMLGASCSISDKALPLFAGARVRIVIHNDAADEKTGRVPSFEAAARWTEQLCAAGAAVETFSLAGIAMPAADTAASTPRAVKDLNDLALCPAEVWQSPEIRAAFSDWDF